MLIDELKIFFNHGIQYVPDVTNVQLTEMFRGRPEINESLTTAEADTLEAFCPVSAFSASRKAIHLGRCTFCKECQFMYPDKLKFTNDYHIATNDLEALWVGVGTKQLAINENLVRTEIKHYFGGALKLRQVSAGGANCCEMELNAAGNVNFDMGRWGIEFVASPRHADGVVITGPISSNMSEALQICYDAIPNPKIVILAGTDAISGGIFADSPALNRSFLDNYPIDLYVPGNPIHPLTFVNGVLNLTRKKK